MKRLSLIIALTACVTYTLNAQSNEFRRWFLKGGLSVGLLSSDVKSSMAFVGAEFGIAFHLAHNNYLSFEFAPGFHDGGQIGRFSYYKTYSDGRREDFTDGKINRSYTCTPILLNWNYLISVGKKFSLRVGPSVGGLLLFASDSYNPSDVDGLPPLRSKEKSGFTGGANVGLVYEINKRLFIDAGYRLMGNAISGEFEDMKLKTLNHRISATVGFRFGKAESMKHAKGMLD